MNVNGGEEGQIQFFLVSTPILWQNYWKFPFTRNIITIIMLRTGSYDISARRNGDLTNLTSFIPFSGSFR